MTSVTPTERFEIVCVVSALFGSELIDKIAHFGLIKTGRFRLQLAHCNIEEDVVIIAGHFDWVDVAIDISNMLQPKDMAIKLVNDF